MLGCSLFFALGGELAEGQPLMLDLLIWLELPESVQ